MTPAAENCAKVKAVVPTVIAPVVVTIHPSLPLVVPSSINTKAPLVTSASASKSVALVGVALTT